MNDNKFNGKDEIPKVYQWVETQLSDGDLEDTFIYPNFNWTKNKNIIGWRYKKLPKILKNINDIW